MRIIQATPATPQQSRTILVDQTKNANEAQEAASSQILGESKSLCSLGHSKKPHALIHKYVYMHTEV